MAEYETDASSEDVDEIRHQLLRRIAIAGVTIVALIAGLTFLDSSDEKQPAPSREVTVPVAESPKPPAPIEPATREPEPTPVPAPSVAPPVAAEPPPPKPITQPITKPIAKTPEKASDKQKATPAVPERTASPETPPLRSDQGAAAKPSTTQATSAKSVVPESTHGAEPPARTQPARPLSSLPAQPSQAAQSVHRYVVQMGVFNNLTNAQELQGKLQKAGIPSQIEAKVQAGPFANRAEAEAAQKKMAELGLDSGILIAPNK